MVEAASARLRLVLALSLAAWSPFAAAMGWKGEIDLGLVATQGNTDTATFNGAFDLQVVHAAWRHALRVEVLHASGHGTTTAERYVGALNNHYDLSGSSYLFGNIRYESDRFSGYSYQAAEALGYGRRFLPTGKLRAELEAGPGLRQSRESPGAQTNEAIFRTAGKLTWHLTPNAGFEQRVRLDSGRANTTIESVTSVRSTIIGSLALKLSETVKYNTSVPPGTRNTDLLTSVNLVYHF
ncbi:hypothetical protein BMS3Abin12_00073 [bacterium BMS3Abin12]|nr:hypothetical protein BMS3Abin12_00073 [bacterium BMS3Abin12]